jgi:hypothetical protein
MRPECALAFLTRPHEIALEVRKANLALIGLFDEANDLALVRNDVHGNRC